MYRERPKAGAVVHLHATHSVAVSCLADVDPADVLPPITAYYVMRVGHLPLIPYYPPGDIDLARAVGEMASKHHAVLLANHGPVVAGVSLDDACRRPRNLRRRPSCSCSCAAKAEPLSAAQVAQLRDLYPPKI